MRTCIKCSWLVWATAVLLFVGCQRWGKEVVVEVDLGSVKPKQVLKTRVSVTNDTDGPLTAVVIDKSAFNVHVTLPREEVLPGDQGEVEIQWGLEEMARGMRRETITVGWSENGKEAKRTLIRIRASVRSDAYKIYLDPVQFTITRDEMSEKVIRRDITYREYFTETSLDRLSLQASKTRINIPSKWSCPENFVQGAAVTYAEADSRVELSGDNYGFEKFHELCRRGKLTITMDLASLPRSNAWIKVPLIFENSLTTSGPEEVLVVFTFFSA